MWMLVFIANGFKISSNILLMFSVPMFDPEPLIVFLVILYFPCQFNGCLFVYEV